jgi:hypothetical protein
VFSPQPDKITFGARAECTRACSSDGALTAEFNWYRTLPADSAANADVAAH